MKKIFLSTVLILMILLSCVGCSSSTMEPESTAESSMFVIVEGGGSTYYQIVYHKETKVMYAVSRGSYNQGTFTLLVDAEGKPLLYEGSR